MFFEHLPEPAAAAVAAEALLRPGGLLVLNVPSSRGALFRLSAVLARLGLPGPYERLWQKEFASPHVSYFARRSLAALIGRHTDLTLVDSFSLPSVSRNGLVARVSGSHGGLVGMGLVAGVWLLSFILPWLPADIEVLVFIREESVAVE